MGRITVPAVCLVLGLALVLVACGSDEADPESDTTGPVASFQQVEGAYGGDAAGIQGVLELVNGCLRVRDDREAEGGRVSYPAFAAGTFSWDADSKTLTVDGSAVTVGDHVLIGGGGSGNRDGISAPQGCDEADGFFMVAPDSVGPLSPDNVS
jgi:hypothetical protein